MLAAAEIEVYGRMARRAPRLTLRDWDVVMAEVRAAQAAASYFWFLSGGPEMFDRIDTAHTPPGNVPLKWGRPTIDPTAIVEVAHVRGQFGGQPALLGTRKARF